MIDRRSLLQAAGLAAAGAALGLPGRALAQYDATLAKTGRAQAGYWRLKIGQAEVIALSDGTLPVDAKVLFAKKEHIDKLLHASWAKSPVDLSVNAYLIPLGERLILVDTGGGDYIPTLKKLTASLAQAGYSPGQVTDILITHVHADHAGGLVSAGRPVFDKAVVHVAKTEAEFWLSEANRAADESRHKVFDMAKATLGPYVQAGRLRPFEGEVELFPGLRSLPAPGHTPGHTFYVLENGGEKLTFWGDVMHIAEVQFPDPSVTILFDVDTKAAAARRKQVFAQAAADGGLFAGAHLCFPGVGRLAKAGPGYRFIPMPYVNDATG